MFPTGLGYFDEGGVNPAAPGTDIIGCPNGLVSLELRWRIPRFKARTRIPSPGFGIVPYLEIVIGRLGRAVLFRNLSRSGRA